MPSRFKRFYQEFGDKIKTSVRMKSDSVFFFIALVSIVAFSILIRLSPIFRGPILLKEFDVWCQFNTTEYLTTHSVYDYFHWISYQSWFPEGLVRYNLRPGLIFSAAGLFNILQFFGIPITLFDLTFYWPAFMGGIQVLMIFFLGKELLDNRAGILAAFFLAFSPGHMQRTIAGFFDNETVGVLAIIGLVLFFIKSIKTGKPLYSIISGLFLGYLAISWGGLEFGILLIPFITAVLIFTGRYSSKLLISCIGTVTTGLLFVLLTPNFPASNFLSGISFAIPFLFLGAILIYHIFYSQKEINPKFYEFIWSIIKWGTIPTVIILAIIFWVAPEILPFSLGARMATIINPLIRNTINLVASVGEHKPSPWSVFYFNAMIPVILTPLGIYFAIKRGRDEDIFVIIFVLLLLYFTGSMIRIILILSPALCLIGGYGLSYVLRFYGSIIRKQPEITRRRKRQIHKTLGTSEGIIVFALVGFMVYAQVYQAVNTSIDQMSWSEMVAGGSFHDWEETLAWTRSNLPGTAVVVSWWDYGYWLTMSGNVTTVNDNGTLNQTRIGATGMAMMQTNEIYSAEVLKALKADYVLVFWGHLLGGLGGDEGKWPWMLRICNDNTRYYQSYGWEKDNWYGDSGTVATVFDESEYINSSSGLYEDKWFDTTLVKLMFYGESTSVQNAQSQLEAYYAQQIEGNEANQVSPRMDDNGNTWKTHIPDNGLYDFKCFIPYYFSSNQLVKIFKMDYTALESSFNLNNPVLSTSGVAHVEIQNTGSNDIEVKSLAVNGIKYNITMENSDSIIPVGNTRTAWVNTNQFYETWNVNDYYNMTVEVAADSLYGGTYTFPNSTIGNTVVNVPDYSMEINRNESVVVYNGPIGPVDFVLNITNTGDDLINIDKSGFVINGYSVDDTFVYNFVDGNFLIKPGETEEITVNYTLGGIPGFTYDISSITYENATDAVHMTCNSRNYKLSILPEERTIVTEEELKVSGDMNRRLIPIDYDKTSFYENGSLQITVQNTGDTLLGLQSLLINSEVTEFDLVSGSKFLDVGETAKINATIAEIDRNEIFEIAVTAIGLTGTRVASDAGYVIPVVKGKALSLLEHTDLTTVYTNETVELTVKNLGTDTITLDKINVNGTDYLLTSAVMLHGSKTLGTFDVAKMRIATGFNKVNESDTAVLSVFAGLTTDSKTIASTIPEATSFSINENSTTPRASAMTNILYLSLVGTNLNNLTIDTISVNGTILNPTRFTIIGGINRIEFVKYLLIQINGDAFGVPDLLVNQKLVIKVTTTQGPVRYKTLTVVAS
jgi:dolichyl-diphosphooligosaccharide--protein glycosyltransferase